MNMRFFLVTPLVLFALLVITMLVKLGMSEDKNISPLIGKKLPSFSLSNLNSGASNLTNSDLNYQYSLLNIFGSWCIACKIEHPFLMKLKENNILSIYGIAWRDKTENVTSYLKQQGNPYNKIGLDFDGKTIIDLGITGAPETFLISPDGIILFRYAGPLTEDIWQTQMLPLIRETK